MPAKRVIMDRDERTDALHAAEMKHQRDSIQSTIVVKDEEVRRSRVRSTVLRGDIATLRTQATQQNERYEKLSKQHSDARSKLTTATKKSNEQEKKLKTQTREIAALRAELQSLNDVSQDSTKLLSEKLALTRELANLKPELEHLKSQLDHHNEVLAEKLALERQVNTLEVELANEKRAAQRAMQKQESKGSEVEDELREQIRGLEKKLAAEKRAAQRAKDDADKEGALEEAMLLQQKELEERLAAERAENAKSRRDVDRQLTETQAENEFLTERLGEMKAKLRETRQELKDCRAELQEAKKTAISRAVEEAVAAKTKTKTKAQTSRKRRAKDADEEPDILQTPVQDEPRAKRPLKKRGLEALVGEKSTFSITPFLTKTINFADGPVDFAAGGGSPSGAPAGMEVDEEDEANASTDDADDADATDEVTEPVEPASIVSPSPAPQKISAKPAKKAASTAKEPKPRGRPKTKVALRESPSAKKNMSLTSNGKTPRGENTLEKVMEEDEEGGDEAQENRTVSMASSKAKAATKATPNEANPEVAGVSERTSGASSVAAEAEPKKKKRKLLGGAPATLFEDDDEGAVQPAAAKRPAVKMQLGAKKGQLGKVKSAAAFAGKAFSPLKRDRRGVNASFLA
ncbi:hypothetical protein RB598_005297 [Gaeumannomyces tritici]